ncbi:MAG: DUF47 domain-containing protein [Deltaproteobacteria bacterium]|nr:MAG: DUF47 domain-containing protein [Deltaproteobacteria bacterium]
MKLKIFPREEKFFELFREQSEKVLEGAKLVKELFDNFERAEELSFQIKRKESEGDDITHKIIEMLNRTFVTPIDREDIHNLASKMDDILDYMQAVSERIILFKIGGSSQTAREMSEVLVRCAEEIKFAVAMIHDLRDSEKIMESCIEVNRLENEADTLLRSAVARLFNEETDPMSVMKWKEIYENLENAVDSCEDVANIIEGVVLKYS